MSQLQIFARLAKVDVAKRQVTGVIASETPDAANEVFDYDTSKPHFEKWSSMVAKLSGGKSVGNVRAMHSNIAAGTLEEITFDDVAKSITVVANIVDDNEWNKVLKGVYTGFSIGGAYVKKWADKVNKALKRYTANPGEVSIVDIGCNPDATFTMCKADGMETEVRFEDTAHGILSKMTDESTDPAELPALSLALAKALGNDIPEPVVGEPDPEEELAKSAYTIERLASLAESVESLLSYSKWTLSDGTPVDGAGAAAIPATLKTAANALYDALLACVSADVTEAKNRLKGVKKALDEQGEPLRKAADLLSVEFPLGEGEAHTVHVNEQLGKFLGLPVDIEKLTKFLGEHDELQKKHDEQAVELTAAKEELEKLKAEPAAPKGAALVVGKETDGVQKQANALSLTNEDGTPRSASDLMKAVHATGGARIIPGSVLAKQQ